MMREWTDKLPARQAAEVWDRQSALDLDQQVTRIEGELGRALAADAPGPVGFYDAMRHFLTLRERLFPALPADPAWKLLVTLAHTPGGSDKATVTGISYGAGVPLSTALRYLAIMEVDGIIERVPSRTDGRQVMIRLTPEGRRRLDAIADKWMTRLFVALAVPVAMLAYLQLG